jgi:hypothetical protein
MVCNIREKKNKSIGKSSGIMYVYMCFNGRIRNISVGTCLYLRLLRIRLEAGAIESSDDSKAYLRARLSGLSFFAGRAVD